MCYLQFGNIFVLFHKRIPLFSEEKFSKLFMLHLANVPQKQIIADLKISHKTYKKYVSEMHDFLHSDDE